MVSWWGCDRYVKASWREGNAKLVTAAMVSCCLYCLSQPLSMLIPGSPTHFGQACLRGPLRPHGAPWTANTLLCAWPARVRTQVQDLTPAQLMLFKFVGCDPRHGLLLAGDTAQTIAKGTNFRFEVIR